MKPECCFSTTVSHVNNSPTLLPCGISLGCDSARAITREKRLDPSAQVMRNPLTATVFLPGSSPLGFCIFTTVSDVKRPEMEDTADGVKMDAGEVTLVNHSSAFRAHLLPHSGFPEDQLALSDQQILPFRQGTLHRAFTGSTSSAAYNPDYHSGMAPCLYSITACPHFFIANTLCLPSRVQAFSGTGT